MTDTINAFITVAKGIPSLSQSYQNLTTAGINIPAVVNARLDYGDDFDINGYLTSLNTDDRSNDIKWTSAQLTGYAKDIKPFIDGYIRYMTLEQFIPLSVVKLATWATPLSKFASKMMDKALPNFVNGRWNGGDAYDLESNSMIPCNVEGIEFIGEPEEVVDKLNIVLNTTLALYKHLFFTNTYRNHPFVFSQSPVEDKPAVQGMGLKEIFDLFFAGADSTEAITAYSELIQNSDIESLKQTWIGIAAYEFFRKEANLPETNSIMNGLSIRDMVLLLNPVLKQDNTAAIDVAKAYIIFAQHLRLNGMPRDQVFNIDTQEWTNVKGQEDFYPTLYGMKVTASDGDVLEMISHTFAVLEMLDLPSKLLL
jgi:hypothetical protein